MPKIIAEEIKAAIIAEARVNPNAKQVWEKVCSKTTSVKYYDVLRIMKQAKIALTGKSIVDSERRKRLNADPQFIAASTARLARLRADPQFAAKSAAAASERLRELHKRPGFTAAATERLRRLDENPAIKAKRIDGIRRSAKARSQLHT